MKNLLALFTLLATSTIGMSQVEHPFKGIETFKYGENRVAAVMEFERNRPGYEMVTGNFQVLDSTAILINGKTRKVAFELIQFVNLEEQCLVEFYYVNDMLYAKNIAYLFPNEDSKKAEKFYNQLNDTLVNNPFMKHFRQGGPVYFEKEMVAAGRFRHYPLKRVHNDVYEGNVGMMYNVENIHHIENLENKGIWVYINVTNTFEIPLKARFRFPKPEVPYGTLEEIAAKIAQRPASDTDTVEEMPATEEAAPVEETEELEPAK